MTVINANEGLERGVEHTFTPEQLSAGRRAHDLDRAHVFHS